MDDRRGICGVYLDREAARAKWQADEATIAKGETVKQLLREIKAAQPGAWKEFLAGVTLDELTQ